MARHRPGARREQATSSLLRGAAQTADHLQKAKDTAAAAERRAGELAAKLAALEDGSGEVRQPAGGYALTLSSHTTLVQPSI